MATDLVVFDIQRFALHDGPGIRTTVFLKGCPLDCLWCHNPESKSSRPQLGYLEKKCVRCGRCQRVCPMGAHVITQDGRHEMIRDRCRVCGRCVNACLNGALKVFGTRMSAVEILKTVIRDRDFYDRSGGGLTVSGGEPMLQFDGLKELLHQAKTLGLHVCLDTCGQAPAQKYLDIRPFVDVFLFDYKVTDPVAHKKVTGVDNHLILSNLRMLAETGSDLFLRCPIIPGINDCEDHYRAIVQLSEQYDAIRQVNLMFYHDMAKGKSQQIGQKYALTELKTMEESDREKIRKTLQALGCTKLREG